MIHLAINGFGRIGRLTLRALYEEEFYASSGMRVVAINSLAPCSAAVHLMQYDSVHGVFSRDIQYLSETSFKITNDNIFYSQLSDPSCILWKNVDVVLECTGSMTSLEKARSHTIHGGAKRVLVSAPMHNAHATIVYGVNESTLTRDHTVVSNASCTTNCLAPIAEILHNNFGIVRGFVTTIHALTGDQKIVDSNHKDLRRARSALESIVPTSTGAARSIGSILPKLDGKLDGASLRVPTKNVSAIDFVCQLKKKVSKEDVKEAFIHNGLKARYQRVLKCIEQPLVSVDFNHTTYSAIVDLLEIRANDTMVRILAWYDNEWAFACRLLDVAKKMGDLD